MNDVVQRAKSKHIEAIIPAFQPAVLAAISAAKFVLFFFLCNSISRFIFSVYFAFLRLFNFFRNLFTDVRTTVSHGYPSNRLWCNDSDVIAEITHSVVCPPRLFYFVLFYRCNFYRFLRSGHLGTMDCAKQFLDVSTFLVNEAFLLLTL